MGEDLNNNNNHNNDDDDANNGDNDKYRKSLPTVEQSLYFSQERVVEHDIRPVGIHQVGKEGKEQGKGSPNMYSPFILHSLPSLSHPISSPIPSFSFSF